MKLSKGGMEKVRVSYKLSDKARAEGIKAGLKLRQDQQLKFSAADLSPKARELWVQLFGSCIQVTLRTPRIEGGFEVR